MASHNGRNDKEKEIIIEENPLSSRLKYSLQCPIVSIKGDLYSQLCWRNVNIIKIMFKAFKESMCGT